VEARKSPFTSISQGRWQSINKIRLLYVSVLVGCGRLASAPCSDGGELDEYLAQGVPGECVHCPEACCPHHPLFADAGTFYCSNHLVCSQLIERTYTDATPPSRLVQCVPYESMNWVQLSCVVGEDVTRNDWPSPSKAIVYNTFCFDATHHCVSNGGVGQISGLQYVERGTWDAGH